jgi:putative intracellular protease/amidase
MKKGTVHLFVFDGMADWEAAFAVAGINHPQYQLVPGRFHVVTASASDAPVTTMGGVRIQPDITLNEVTPTASRMLILPGGESWEHGGNGEAIEKARTFLVTGAPVAAICAATWALGHAGLLNDRLHTSNSREYLVSKGYRGGGLYCDVPAVTDKNLITASGVAPVDFAYEIFKMLDLYSDAALEAWYGLFKQGDASKYYDLARAAAQ